MPTPQKKSLRRGMGIGPVLQLVQDVRGIGLRAATPMLTAAAILLGLKDTGLV